MTTITNNHNAPLGLPGGQVIASGASEDVPEWDSIKSHSVVAQWVAGGVLVAAAEADEKGPILAQLAELGIVRDRRAGVDTLQALLDDALNADPQEKAE